MYGPRRVRLHATVTLPSAAGRIAEIGRSGGLRLASSKCPSPKIGVGAVIFELPPSFHNSFPVRGSEPRIKFDALVASTGPAAVSTTVGVPHEGSSSRFVFHTVSPVSAFRAVMNEPF